MKQLCAKLVHAKKILKTAGGSTRGLHSHLMSKNKLKVTLQS